MKTCPVCQGNVFDDMNTCYNCMHRFDEEAKVQDEASEAESEMFTPQWVMPKGEGSFFREYLSKYSAFLTSFLKSCY